MLDTYKHLHSPLRPARKPLKFETETMTTPLPRCAVLHRGSDRACVLACVRAGSNVEMRHGARWGEGGQAISTPARCGRDAAR